MTFPNVTVHDSFLLGCVPKADISIPVLERVKLGLRFLSAKYGIRLRDFEDVCLLAGYRGGSSPLLQILAGRMGRFECEPSTVIRKQMIPLMMMKTTTMILLLQPRLLGWRIRAEKLHQGRVCVCTLQPILFACD